MHAPLSGDSHRDMEPPTSTDFGEECVWVDVHSNRTKISLPFGRDVDTVVRVDGISHASSPNNLHPQRALIGHTLGVWRRARSQPTLILTLSTCTVPTAIRRVKITVPTEWQDQRADLDRTVVGQTQMVVVGGIGDVPAIYSTDMSPRHGNDHTTGPACAEVCIWYVGSPTRASKPDPGMLPPVGRDP